MEADYLGDAAKAKHEAKKAIKDGEFDDAWRLLNDQKSNYLQHGNYIGATKAQIIALDGTVHEDMANVLRLEGRDDEALAHIMYCAASSPRRSKTVQNKVGTYFKRCKFKVASSSTLNNFMSELKREPDIRIATSQVDRWRAADKGE